MDTKLCVFLLALMQISAVVSLKCYVCEYSEYESEDAYTQGMLNDLASNEEECLLNGETYEQDSRATSVTCASYEDSCLKMNYYLEMTFFDVDITVTGDVRSCMTADVDAEPGCSDDFDSMFGDVDGVTGGSAYACGCDSELCNAASSVTVGYMALVLSAMVAFWKL